MSTHDTPSGAPVTLPELTDESMDRIENAVFADIARERDTARARRVRRGRIWMAGGAAAAIIAIAAFIAPSVGSLVSGSSGASSEETAVSPAVEQAPPDQAGGSSSGAEPGIAEDAAVAEGDRSALTESSAGAATQDAADGRDIITTASATVEVDDATVAARTIANAAVAHGGYVESLSLGTDGDVPVTDSSGAVYDSWTYPVPSDSWITVRIPSDQLNDVVDQLSDVGEVTASSVNRQDVTTQTIDLEARIEAAQASVDRLTALMAQATSVADLIAAESALSERQAMLESYQQQLEMLEDQVAMSSLTVTLIPEVEAVEADPAGFGDGLAAGWNGLIAALNGIVVALGFMIPWLVVAAVVGFIVWGIVRFVRRRRQARRTDATPPRASGVEEPPRSE
jgi:hypothetical protein